MDRSSSGLNSTGQGADPQFVVQMAFPPAKPQEIPLTGANQPETYRRPKMFRS